MPITARQRSEFQMLGWFHLGEVFAADELCEMRCEYDLARAAAKAQRP